MKLQGFVYALACFCCWNLCSVIDAYYVYPNNAADVLLYGDTESFPVGPQKRAFDRLEGLGFTKRAFDRLEGLGFTKRAFDRLEGLGFTKRVFDRVGSGFGGFEKRKRAFDRLSAGFGFDKRAFDRIGSGFGFDKKKRTLDRLEGAFGFEKRGDAASRLLQLPSESAPRLVWLDEAEEDL